MKNIVFTICFICLAANLFGYYNPEQGRWTSRDPIKEKGGLNLYGMVANDPIGRWDYLGMWGEDVHKDKTRIWAIDEGIKATAAEAIGKYDDAVDGYLMTFIGGGISPNPLWGDQSYHFDRPWGGSDSRIDNSATHLQEAMDFCTSGTSVFTSTDDPENAVKSLGTALHPLQDYWAHGDYGQLKPGNTSIWSTHNGVSPQKQFGSPAGYPDDITLDVVGSADGRPVGVPQAPNGGIVGNYVWYRYEKGTKRITETERATKVFINSFKNHLRSQNKTACCRCYNYFL